MDPEHLADILASHDAHLTLDIPLELADALRRLLADRESRIRQLEGRAATAELALLNLTKRIERDYLPDEDDAFCAEESWPHLMGAVL